jgi:hypothetical protein
MAIAYCIAQAIFQEKAGVPCVITSGSDGKHGPNSLHYQGKALDFRTRHLRPDQVHPIYTALKAALGAQYDTVLEEDHVHCEFDPKEAEKSEDA